VPLRRIEIDVIRDDIFGSSIAAAMLPAVDNWEWVISITYHKIYAHIPTYNPEEFIKSSSPSRLLIELSPSALGKA
jgi:hypothetical protein